MDRPRPMPPNARPSPSSSCSKGSKMRSRCEGEMPMPVSVMLTSTVPASGLFLLPTVTSPSGVNFRAFMIRLYSTCVQRCTSASIVGTFSDLLMSLTVGRLTACPCLSTAWSSMWTVSSMIWDRLQGALLSFMVFDLIAEMSMMSVTRSRSRVEQFLIMFSFFCRFGSCSLRASASLRPQIPWIGDLSSCETTAMNRIFLSSSDLCCVMSWPMLTTPTMAPIASRRAVALSSSTTMPALFPFLSRQLKRSSKFAVSPPCNASFRTLSMIF
mmetsp:Transcript_68341/g.200633  ORF Transcript_68341/g.200633 Transcript_68341/m.200633 type:complete len:270 (+) Transcript_68341:285-1094(+)